MSRRKSRVDSPVTTSYVWSPDAITRETERRAIAARRSGYKRLETLRALVAQSEGDLVDQVLARARLADEEDRLRGHMSLLMPRPSTRVDVVFAARRRWTYSDFVSLRACLSAQEDLETHERWDRFTGAWHSRGGSRHPMYAV